MIRLIDHLVLPQGFLTLGQSEGRLTGEDVTDRAPRSY